MMKTKILFFLSFICLLVSCSKKGDVYRQPQDVVSIHGEIYKAAKIVPCDNCESIWIVYPKNPKSTSTVINSQYDVDEDTTTNISLINLN